MSESQQSYVQWKDWQDEDFGKFGRPAGRYYAWHVDRARGGRAIQRVLEIGFGNGAFLGYCTSRGWNAAGIEIDAELRDRAARAGHTVATDIDDLNDDDRFDLIVMFDVLEHLPADRLVTYMRGVAGRLADGGAVLLRVPNGDSPFGRRHQHGDLTHVTTFGEFKLRQVAMLCGLELVHLGEAPWDAQQWEGRTLRSLFKAVLRGAIERVLGFAYFGAKLDLSSNLVAVLRHSAAVEPAAP